ncbi:hypothetical protein C451_02455 [Halococcus thailandensis JCM 13552]|uniref:Uncharacterized protein n=1 Tax=Halococcus thailandensis JCM 13552 TaxID=1227457 RepID=M0NH43_9EURY|nr:hypothetical protein C451_02455 [Halococcus thailandensis JCM 13552]
MFTNCVTRGRIQGNVGGIMFGLFMTLAGIPVIADAENFGEDTHHGAQMGCTDQILSVQEVS